MRGGRQLFAGRRDAVNDAADVVIELKRQLLKGFPLVLLGRLEVGGDRIVHIQHDRFQKGADVALHAGFFAAVCVKILNHGLNNIRRDGRIACEIPAGLEAQLVVRPADAGD